MYAVALTRLATPLEVECAELARDLGKLVFEVRLLLAGGFPAVVLTTPDRARAAALLQRLEARGHDATLCDLATVVPAGRMVAIREPTLGETALTLAAAPTGSPTELPYADILALLRASHRREVHATVEGTAKTFSPARALATGGMITNKSATKTTSSSTEEREQVLYLFRRSGQTPWILRETGVRFRAEDRALTALENFTRTITRLRELAPGAMYDERLLTTRKVAERVVKTTAGGMENVTSTVDGGVDLAAHLLAGMAARR